jgi:hypothetical protein
VEADPFAAVLEFPVLRKQDYWDHGAGMRLLDVPADHIFYTSGTEGGIPTEQPWDRFTFQKSFGESSALALAAVGARPGDRLLLGTPLHGALGLSFEYACRLLGLVCQPDASAFSDPGVLQSETLPFVRGGVDILVGAPGTLVQLAHRLRDHGIDPRTLGVRGIVSGIGTFLSDQHRDFFVEAFAPEVIHEQGGKNEILHAPGGRRYLRDDPSALDRPGFLHVLPWAAYVVAVDANEAAQGKLRPIGHEREGLLLMTRLSAGGDGCVAYINDAGDFGMTVGFGGVDSAVSPSGNTMPAFRFMGRTGGAIENKIGDTLFTEELVRALSLAAREAGLDAAAAVQLRIQAVLARDADPRMPDTLFWIVGAPRELHAARPDEVARAAQLWVRYWPRYAVYRGPLAQVMGFGGWAVVDGRVMPHAGRDKPQYRLAVALPCAPGEPHAAAFARYMQRDLHAEVLCSGER